jgi:hypothetical protein
MYKCNSHPSIFSLTTYLPCRLTLCSFRQLIFLFLFSEIFKTLVYLKTFLPVHHVRNTHELKHMCDFRFFVSRNRQILIELFIDGFEENLGMQFLELFYCLCWCRYMLLGIFYFIVLWYDKHGNWEQQGGNTCLNKGRRYI